METTSTSLRRFLPLLAALAVLLAYANHFQNSFHFDDIHTIVDNPAIRSPGNIPRFFTDASSFSVLPPNRTYRPVLSTSLALDYRLAHGLNPVAFHIDSFTLFLLHLACMVGLFTLLLPATQRGRFVALLATTLYGLHPAIAETVNYIIQRGDILSTLGVVAALLVYLRAPSMRRYGLYLVPLALGLLSKPPALIFPALLLAYHLIYTPELPLRRIVRAVAPSVLLIGALLALESHLTPKSFAPSNISEARYLLTQPFVALRYFAAFFLPIHLNVDTDLEPFASLTGQAAAGLAFLALLLAATAALLRRARTSPDLRPIAFGLLWFVVGLLPTSLYRLSEVENDHRMYLPFVGLVLAAAATCATLYDRLAIPKADAIAAIVLILATFAWATHRRNAVWRTEETLWLDDIQKSPHNGRGLMIYGLTQMNKGDLHRALDCFQQAERYVPLYDVLQINLGIVYGSLANPVAAQQHFLRALTLAPTDDLPHLYYGRWLASVGRTGEAISQLRTALLLNPARIEPHNLLTESLITQGAFDEARASIAATLALAPGDPTATSLLASLDTPTAEAWLNRSLAEYQQQRYQQSIASARRALALRPGYAEAWNNIGAAFASLGQWDPPIQADRQALALRQRLPPRPQQPRLGALPPNARPLIRRRPSPRRCV
jgi:tetratricopeptide (TPR) repeat protein